MPMPISPKLPPQTPPVTAEAGQRAAAPPRGEASLRKLQVRPILGQSLEALARFRTNDPQQNASARLQAWTQNVKRVVTPALADPDYSALLRAKWCNQIGTGIALGSYIMMLQQVGLATVGQGLLAFWALNYLESLVLALGVSLHSGSLRDAYNRRERPAHDPKGPEAPKLRSELAALLWTCEFLNTGITLTTLAAIGSVYAGLLGGAPLFLALAALQVARASITTYQHSFTNALKPLIADDVVRNDVMRDHQYVFNSAEMGIGRVVLMSSVAGLVQIGVPMLPVSYVLPTLAGLMVGSSFVTAYGKLPLLAYLPTAPAQAAQAAQSSARTVPTMPAYLEGVPSMA